MYSSELRSTFSQELGAALHNHVSHKLVELANDNSLPTPLRNEAQLTKDMITASYDCAIFNPTTGVHEMIIPAALILADSKQGVDTPLLILLVDFSRKRTGNTAVNLLDMYPDAIIIRVDIPYLDPEARLATIRAGNTASPYTCLYDIIIRANTAAANSFSHDAAAAGRLSIRLRFATIRRCLSLAAVRQKHMDILRLKSTGHKPSQGHQAASPLGGFGTPLIPHGLHTLAFPATPSLTSTCKGTVTAVEHGRDEGLAASNGGHGLGLSYDHYGGRVSGPVLAIGGFGGHRRHVANLKTFLNLGRRLARGGRY
ncbi:hypothetical protein SLS53_006839 [Cytospora paraplurivora]|uniref:Uncharacterized protein n=1 Tax=Cytospora paraplurivora TaxID=2898453 RepID=A0AAN9UA75_9PEZI